MKNVVIFDLDGTIADPTPRLHLMPTKDLHLTDSWTEFNRACLDDLPIRDTIQICNNLCDSGIWVIILTGRSDIAFDETANWLTYYDVNYDQLIMRPHGDNRKDYIIKEEYLRDVVGLENIVAAWDDSANVVSHFRSMGITTYQVAADIVRTDLMSHGVEKLK